MRHSVQKALISIGFASVSLAVGESAFAAPARKCPFESRTIQQVVEESKSKSVEKFLISQAAAEEMAPMTTTSPETAVEQVRAVYKKICSRSRQVESQPQSIQAPVEQPIQPVEQPVVQPVEQSTPVRALW